MKTNSLPSFHIFCAGTQMTGYTWLAAKCLEGSCPVEKRDLLKINIHLIGQNRKEKANVKKVFDRLSHVEIVDNIILLDERKTGFDRLRVDLFDGKSRILAHKIKHKIPILRPLCNFIAGPGQRGRLGFYHHEWISAVCEAAQQDEAVVIVDTDMFVADPEFFSDQHMTLTASQYAGGWIWRTNNSIKRNNHTYYPLGTELFIINPKLHRQLDFQKHNRDLNSYSLLKSKYSDIEIENETFIDTLFIPSWIAQLEGYDIDTRFNGLKVCHPGGVGHIQLNYLKNIPSEVHDKENWHRLNVGRVRIHSRVINLIQKLGMGHTLTQPFLDRLSALEHFIKKDKDLNKLWESDGSLIDGDENMILVEKLFNY